MATDLLGRATTPDEDALIAAYRALVALAGRDLPPCAAANVRAALSHCAVAVGDLGLDYAHLLDIGC